MQSDINTKTPFQRISGINTKKEYLSVVERDMPEAWNKIAPFWPLKNLIAVNPLQGLENLPFEQAIIDGQSYFQQAIIPANLEDINRETIKWCQAFLDEGQATINMPFRDQGFYQAWRQLIRFDKQLNLTTEHDAWLENLPRTAEQVIAECLIKLNIPLKKIHLFLTLLLTTLPGWASYIKYRTEWNENALRESYPITQADYIAMRLVITCLLWSEALDLLEWHQAAQATTTSEQMKKIITAEKHYQSALLNVLSQQDLKNKMTNDVPAAQFIFCIDVRSEPFRRALEAQGNYETLGFAGFFGIPVQIKNELTEEAFSSCPVLLNPKHTVKEAVLCSAKINQKILAGKKQLSSMKRLYQALKYTFTIPFVLVDVLGPLSGLWMSVRTVAPRFSTRLKNKLLNTLRPTPLVKPVLVEQDTATGIDFNNQCVYAESALRIIGLTDHFSPFIILCGHGSLTQNNAYASALDCGACGGNQGGSNALILAEILNNMDVRIYLAKKNILIPAKTKFIAALHNTTLDEVTLYPPEDENLTQAINKIKDDLTAARKVNNEWRCLKMGYKSNKKNKNDYIKHIKKRSADWAQTRPEWGLARNASFIIGPRLLTREVDLDGQAFLHSYDWRPDKDGASLATILTAPMVVAQWINSQYLFSSIDNVAYGSGSKVTHDITGKIGIMQGNASDLMHGLPLQSVSVSDHKKYHEPSRLMTVVYAPKEMISHIISNHCILQKLFGNGWVFLFCIEPENGGMYQLQRDFTWSKAC